MESSLPAMLPDLNWPQPGQGWAAFGQIDQFRLWQGRLLEGLGWGPNESPSRIVFTKPALTLRAYEEAGIPGVIVLMVPAPIKRAYLWDLAPGASVVQQLLRGGLHAYLVQWEPPGVDQQEYGLAEYVDQLILDALRAIERETGSRRVFLAGHSLGGTLAAIFAGLHPGRIAGLILAGSPLHFGRDVDPLGFLVSTNPRASAFTAITGNVPGSVLDAASILGAPASFAYSRWADWLASLPDPCALATHLRVERWTDDEMPLARRFFEEIVDFLYREDRWMRGTLELAGRRAMPQAVVAPLLCIVERQSAVAPPGSVRPFYEAVGSRQKRWLWYAGDVGVSLQHVGMLVGRTAHHSLWPEIVRWIRQQSG
jgi:polyhydroxyalkanoate synthase